MEHSTIAKELVTSQCDDIGITIFFEYVCPVCGKSATYSTLGSYDYYFSNKGFFTMKIICEHCKKEISILDDENP